MVFYFDVDERTVSFYMLAWLLSASRPPANTGKSTVFRRLHDPAAYIFGLSDQPSFRGSERKRRGAGSLEQHDQY